MKIHASPIVGKSVSQTRFGFYYAKAPSPQKQAEIAWENLYQVLQDQQVILRVIPIANPQATSCRLKTESYEIRSHEKSYRLNIQQPQEGFNTVKPAIWHFEALEPSGPQFWVTVYPPAENNAPIGPCGSESPFSPVLFKLRFQQDNTLYETVCRREPSIKDLSYFDWVDQAYWSLKTMVSLTYLLGRKPLQNA